MAPEQFDDPDGVDFRADMYGLGCVLYFALTGNPAYSGRTISQLVSAKINGPVPNPRTANNKLSKSVCDLVMKLLAVKREDRPASYQALITSCTCSDKVSAEPRQRFVVVGALGIIAALAIIGWWLLATSSVPPAQPTPPSVVTTAAAVPPIVATTPTPSIPLPAAPTEIVLGEPQSLWQSSVISRLSAWQFAPGAQWQSSETHAEGIAGSKGMISRTISGNRWELMSTFSVGNDENGKTDVVRMGVQLPDTSEVFIIFTNLATILSVRIERTYADGKTPREYIHSGQVPVSTVRLHFALDGQHLRMTINDIPLERSIGLAALPTAFFIDAQGMAPVEVSELTMRLPQEKVLK
jgi:serine/threonine protein kinase